MATNRKEMERRLRCNKVEGLPKEFQIVAGNMAVKYLQKYSMRDSGYELSYELVKNRVENLMLDALNENPFISPGEFVERTRLTEIFIDPEAIMYLVELAGEGDSEDYFYYAYHFFALSVFSYINHHSFYISPLEKVEVLSVLYTQVHFALKRCAEKKVMFNFHTLYLMFKAAIFELNGVTRFPFSLRRKDVELYFRFRANVINNDYGKTDMNVLSDMLSLSYEKILCYWGIFVSESNGFLSTSVLLEDENLENIFGKMEEAGFLDVEIEEMRNRLFKNEIDRGIFDSLVGNGDGTFSKEEIEKIGTNRYRINQVKETLRRNNTEFEPIE